MLSRLWYIVLAALVAAALMAAMLAQNAYSRTTASRLSSELVRDRTELELWLRLEARTRLDAIAPLAANGDVRTALASASGRQDRSMLDATLRSGLEQHLTRLNNALAAGKADILFAVDVEGQIIGQVGGNPPPVGANLGQFPVVARALRGYATDDVWRYDGQLYRVATHPVAQNGNYVGAVVHTAEMDQTFAEQLAGRIAGASVGFFAEDGMVASFTPEGVANAPGTPEFAAGIAAARADSEFVAGNASAALALGTSAFAIYAPVTGTATHVGAGYVVGRPGQAVQSSTAIFENATPADRDRVPLPWVLGAALVLGLMGILFSYLEHDRPLKKLLAGVRVLARREVDRLDIATYAGGLRQVADDINTALDKVASEGRGSTPRVSVKLDEILGAAPMERESVPYFGFATDTKANVDAIPAAPAAVARVPIAVRTPAPLPPATAAAVLPPTPPVRPAAPEPPLARTPPPAPVPSGGSTVLSGTPKATPYELTDPMSLVPPPPPVRPNRPTEAAPGVAKDDALIRSNTAEAMPLPSRKVATADEERHFREVYDRFVALKLECGESIAGLTYEKFEVTLQTNRDAILGRHEASRVRFTVYNKGGKAALRATPLSD